MYILLSLHNFYVDNRPSFGVIATKIVHNQIILVGQNILNRIIYHACMCSFLTFTKMSSYGLI